MSSRFQASSEDMSTDSLSDVRHRSRDCTESADEEINVVFEDDVVFEADEEVSKAVEMAANAGTIAKAMAKNKRLQNLQPHQHASLFYLALIEGRCKAQAAKKLNEGRRPHDYLSENDPRVAALAKTLFVSMRKELIKAGMIPDEFAEKNVTLPELQPYLGSFDTILDNFASTALNNISISNAFSAIEDGSQSLSVSEDYSLSFDQSNLSKALVLAGKDAMDPVEAEAELLTQLRSSDRSRSLYKQDYKEIQLLGKGGFGQVTLVQSVVDRMIWAVKRIDVPKDHLQYLAQHNRLGDLTKEVAIMAQLKHHNIVRYSHCWIHVNCDLQSSKSKPTPKAKGFLRNASDDDGSQPEDLDRKLEKMKLRENAADYDGTTSDDLKKPLNQVKRRKPSPAVVDFQDIEFGYSSDNESRPPKGKGKELVHLPIPKDHHTPSYTSADSVVPMAPILDEQTIINSAQIYIKMTAYPVNLEEFIWKTRPSLQHCHHLLPSLYILRGILDGLEHLYQYNIIHRDLKPANIFLEKLNDGFKVMPGFFDCNVCPDCTKEEEEKKKVKYICPCIGDFGLSCILPSDNTPYSSSSGDTDDTDDNDEDDENNQGPAPRSTPPIIGTALYTPAIPSSPPCPKLDIYALGIITFELLYPMKTKQERSDALPLLREKAEFPKDFGKTIGEWEEEVKEAILGMCERDREERWGVRQVRDWIEGMIERVGGKV